MIIRKFLVVCVLILGLFENAIAGLNDGLVAYYPFDGNTNDFSGNENHGVINGAIPTENRFGDSASAYSFDGATNYIEVNDSESLNISQEITISVWIRSNVELSSDVSFVRKEVSSENAYILESVRGRIYLWINGKTAGITSSEIIPGKWYYLVGTYDKNNIKFYLNGVLRDSINYSDPIGQNHEPIHIGAYHNNDGRWMRFFDGTLDDIRIYNRALSSSEIQELYTKKSILSSNSSSSCTSPQAITVSENLDIQIPSLNYTSLLGTQNLWVNLKYYGKGSNGEILWKLKDFGTNP